MNLDYEKRFEPFCMAGVDEVGRGALAGPVFAAAASIQLDLIPEDLRSRIRDSKCLSPSQREDIADSLISSQSIVFALGQSSVEEIDRLNIQKATFLAMIRAVDGLAKPLDCVMVDGNRAPFLKFKTETLIRGDSQCLSIAIASIIAKVKRDNHMRDLDTEHPQYHWADNKGYGTQKHREAILELGFTYHHRRSFAPVKHLINRLF